MVLLLLPECLLSYPINHCKIHYLAFLCFLRKLYGYRFYIYAFNTFLYIMWDKDLTLFFCMYISSFPVTIFLPLFLLVGGQLLYNIVVVFAIHWRESAMDLHVFPIPIPPPASLSIPSLWVFPVHQPWAPVSCIQPGLVICFTLDSVLVSVLFSQNTPPSHSPTESKSLFCTSVSPFLFCI